MKRFLGVLLAVLISAGHALAQISNPGITQTTGDVTASGTGAVPASVVRIQGRNVASTAPTNHQAMAWVTANSDWEPLSLACADISNAGTSCTVNTGTSGATLGLLNGNLTFGGNNTFAGSIILSGLSSGTIVSGSFLGLDSGNHIVLGSAGGGGGSVSITAGNTGVVVSPSPLTGTGTISLGNPSASTLGGIESLAAVTSKWINAVSTSGVPSATQPAFTDISGTAAAAQLPNPTASTLGGIESLAAVTSKWINTISTSGVPGATQPAFTDISGAATLAQLPSIATNTILGNNSGSTGAPSAITVGAGLVSNASGLQTTIGDVTKSANYTVASTDMGGIIYLTGTATLTVPAISSTVLTTGMSVSYQNIGSGTWTISSTPAINGLPSTSVPPGVNGTLVGNGASLDWTGFATPTSTAIGGVITKDCTSGGQFIQKIDATGTPTCATPAGGGNVSAAGSLPVHTVVIGAGSQSVVATATGASGIPLIGQGASADPVFGTATVPGGGTGATTLTAHGVLLGEGTGAIAATSAGASGDIFIGQGASDPIFSTNAVLSSGQLTLGTANTTLGSLIVEGSTSGAVTIKPQAAAGTWEFDLPTSAGTAGQVLTSQGGAGTAATWTTPGTGTVTSISTTSPITGGTITATGTIACATCVTSAAALTAHAPVIGGGSQTSLTTAAMTDGQLLVGQTSADPLPKTLTGDVTLTAAGATAIKSGVALAGSPTTTTQAAGDNTTKISTDAFVHTEVANAIAGVNPAVAVQEATAAILPNSPTYNNGASGIGAFITTLTLNTPLVVDGQTPVLNDRILVKNEASGGGLGAAKNGVYTLTTVATTGVAWILTRALDYDTPSDMNNTGAIPVVNGTVNTQTQWVQTSQVATVGTDAVTFAQFTLNPSTLVTASSPGVGIAHFAGSTQAVTSSAIVGADIASSVALAGSPTTTTQAAKDNSIKIATTAYVDAPTPLTTGTSVSLTAPRQYFICTGTCTVTPPTPAAGYEFCVRNGDNVATVITFAAIASVFYEKTTYAGYGTVNTAATSGGAAGDKLCILGLDSTHYLVASFNGTWSMP